MQLVLAEGSIPVHSLLERAQLGENIRGCTCMKGLPTDRETPVLSLAVRETDWPLAKRH